MTTHGKVVLFFPPYAGKPLSPPAGLLALAGRRHNGRLALPRELGVARTTAKLFAGRSLRTVQGRNSGRKVVCGVSQGPSWERMRKVIRG